MTHDGLRFTWPGIAHSAKNGRRWIKHGRKWRLKLSDDAEHDKASIRELFSLLFARQMRDGTVLGRDELRVLIEVDKAKRETTITVESLGPRKFTAGRRRDLHGGIELIMDALQGLAFDDDCQTADLRIRYV